MKNILKEQVNLLTSVTPTNSIKGKKDKNMRVWKVKPLELKGAWKPKECLGNYTDVGQNLPWS